MQQIQFANKKSIEFIDKILENEKQSIIIIQSDHGSAFGINLQDPTDDDAYSEDYPILMQSIFLMKNIEKC